MIRTVSSACRPSVRPSVTSRRVPQRGSTLRAGPSPASGWPGPAITASIKLTTGTGRLDALGAGADIWLIAALMAAALNPSGEGLILQSR